MLKLIMKKFSEDVKFREKELYYEFYKYELALPFLLNFRMVLCLIIPFIPFLWYKYSGHSRLIPAIVAAIFAVVLIYLFVLSKQTFFSNKKTRYKQRTLELKNIIRKKVTISKNSVLSKKDWKLIKKTNKELYEDLLGDKSDDDSFYYARQIGLIVKDVELMYVAINDKSEDEVRAHALVKRDGKVYDPFLKRSFNLNDYARLYEMETYEIWSFKEYSKRNFEESVKKDFTNWCAENEFWLFK